MVPEWGQRLLCYTQSGLIERVYSVVTGGSFSLGAPRHLIKPGQEMSLFADWPCVFLRRPPSGTADMHHSGGPAPTPQNGHFSSPLPTTSIPAPL